MSTKRRRATKPVAPPTLPKTVTVDREWLRERMEWLDIASYATKVIREISELASSHSEAFQEQARTGSCSSAAAELFRRWGFEAEHCAIEELGKILEQVEHVAEGLHEVVYPRPAVTP